MVDSRVIWSPDAGPQTALVQCPVYEVFYGGARGGGKTDGMLGDWMIHQARYGKSAGGVFFRRTLLQLDAVISRSRQIFPQLGARYKGQFKQWEFPGGAVLKFRYLDKKHDAENYQGHSYTRLYFEEVTNWPDSTGIDELRATLRSPDGVPVGIRMTGNPGGVGHNWVKQRFVDAGEPWGIITDQLSKKQRVYIPSRLENNTRLSRTDYSDRLNEVGRPELVKAWLNGDWNVVSGAFLGSLWDTTKHVIAPFRIPAHWVRWRSMDWGYARPYSVIWYAMDENGKTYVYRELYGIANGSDGRFLPNHGSRENAETVARRIKQLEKFDGELRGNTADPAIWAKVGTELSIEEHFRREGVRFEPASTGRDSRVAGAQEITRQIQAGTLVFFSSCLHTIRTIASLPVSPLNPEDVDTDGEDHAWDSLRYGIRRRKRKASEPEKPAFDHKAWMRNL
ncbi:terminase family protein [Thiothrix sp.]|jgi:hypothetical protein|uniref:terminase large subunit domain-containing protein n=1 Tax=Thiothrix sp. TaxID=1032 RepID=UPI00257F2F05|nr:terminase family protein [Thiothrix sp.]